MNTDAAAGGVAIARVAPAALILAGSRGGRDPVAEAEGAAHKALVLLDGQPLLACVVTALRAAGIERIAVAADHPEVIQLAHALGAEIVAPGAGPSQSVALALAALGTPLVVTTADHALLRGAWVMEFLADAPAGSDVALMLARRDRVEAAVPGTRRTWLRFADGEWSGCNLFYLVTPDALRAIELWQIVEADRKRPWRIAARLGWSTLWAYLRGRLGAGETVARLGSRIGLQAALVPARNGLAAVDVDTPDDLALVRFLVRTAGDIERPTSRKPF